MAVNCYSSILPALCCLAPERRLSSSLISLLSYTYWHSSATTMASAFCSFTALYSRQAVWFQRGGLWRTLCWIYGRIEIYMSVWFSQIENIYLRRLPAMKFIPEVMLFFPPSRQLLQRTHPILRHERYMERNRVNIWEYRCLISWINSVGFIWLAQFSRRECFFTHVYVADAFQEFRTMQAAYWTWFLRRWVAMRNILSGNWQMCCQKQFTYKNQAEMLNVNHTEPPQDPCKHVQVQKTAVTPTKRTIRQSCICTNSSIMKISQAT